MEETLTAMLALEKIKRPAEDSHIVYTYVLAPEGEKTVGFFIPLYVAPTPELAEEKAKEIIEVTGYKDVLTYPMGLWISLGNSSEEKVTPVHVRDQIRDYAKEEERKNKERSKERKRIEEEVKEEQQKIMDPSSIESYYYDWFCAVQNKSYLDRMKQEMASLEQAYHNRLEAIKTKNSLYPEFKDTWQDLLLTRLTKRGEKGQAQAVIDEANKIMTQENFYK